MPLPSGRMNWKGTPFWEHAPDSPYGGGTRDHCRETRHLVCNWADRFVFRRDILGYAEVKLPGTSNARLDRKLPMPYDPPELLAMGGVSDYLWAVAVENMKPVGKPVSVTTDGMGYATYDLYCEMDVHFEPMPMRMAQNDNAETNPTPESQRFCQITWNPAGEYLNVKGGYFQWVTETDPQRKRTAIDIPKLDLQADFTVKWFSVPGVPYPHQEYIGYCNSEAITFQDHIRTYTFNPEMLLLLDVDQTPIWMPNGKPAFDYLFRFQYRPNFNLAVETGHNYVRRFLPGPPPTWNYERISIDGTAATTLGNLLKDRKDLRQLFQMLRD